VVHSKFQDLVPKRIELDDPELERPDEDKIKEVIHWLYGATCGTVSDILYSVNQCSRL